MNHPFEARVIVGGATDSGSFLAIEPAGDVVLTALKPAGNPLATGRLPARHVDRVTVRVYEATGRPAQTRIRLWAPITGAVEADLLEKPGGPSLSIGEHSVDMTLAGAAIGHLLVGVQAAGPDHRDDPAGRGCAEPHQPVFSRYWLHNSGPAPIGNQPVSVHVNPPYAPASGPVTLTVTVSSDLTEDTAAGKLNLVAPDGWRCTPPTVRYRLGPGGHSAYTVVVTPPEQPYAGVYWMRARTTYDGQTIEDVARLLVDVHAPETIDAAPHTTALRLRAGQSAAIELSLSSDAATATSVQVRLISPWHTWEMFPDANTGVDIPARGTVELRLPVRIPPGARPGRWWALVKLAHAGQLQYTQPIEVEVLP
jgi:alpha-mannosidase